MSDKTSNVLLSCPFCGGEAQLKEFNYLDGKINYFVECDYTECGVVTETADFDTPEEAIKAWNTRKPLERIVERLEESKGIVIDERGEVLYQEDYFIDIDDAIAIVKGEGGLNG